MATTANRQGFISRARRLAADFIKTSDGFNALAAELVYTGLAQPADQGGLTADDFVMLNIDLTPEKLLAFYQVLGELLAPLTVEQKKVIYAVKGSAQKMKYIVPRRRVIQVAPILPLYSLQLPPPPTSSPAPQPAPD